MSEYRADPGPAPPAGRRPGCGGGCLRSVIGLAILIGLVVAVELGRRGLVTRLQAPDYQTGILAESGGWTLQPLAGFALFGLMSVVALRRGQRGFGAVAGALAVICVGLAATLGADGWRDIVDQPATARGTVTHHYRDARKGGTTRYIQMNGATYRATLLAYQQVADGQCAVLTYGPRTRLVTAAHPCPAAA